MLDYRLESDSCSPTFANVRCCLTVLPRSIAAMLPTGGATRSSDPKRGRAFAVLGEQAWEQIPDHTIKHSFQNSLAA